MYIKLINNKFYWIVSFLTIHELISDLGYNGVWIIVPAMEMEMVMVEELCLSISSMSGLFPLFSFFFFSSFPKKLLYIYVLLACHALLKSRFRVWPMQDRLLSRR